MDLLTEIERYKREGYGRYPVAVKRPRTRTAEEFLLSLKAVSSHVFILESAEEKRGAGRYTFLGFDPRLELSYKDGTLKVRGGMELDIACPRPHEHIRKALAAARSPVVDSLPPFTGGLVGYFSYEFISFSEPTLRLTGESDEGWCDVDLMAFDKIIAIDNAEDEVFFIANADLTRDPARELARTKGEIESMEKIAATPAPPEPEGKMNAPLTPLFTREQYCDIVERAKRYIYEGDIFQCVPSNRWAAPYEGSLTGVYRDLKRTNPSPYMFYFSGSEVEMAGASPETLVKLVGRKVSTYPLAGSRRRGATPEEDKALERELLADEKELAEHNMLVDLGRNDLGKICEFGSVKVERYMNIERYSCIMHIGSAVSGTIREGLDALDAIDAVLPAGTLSGAPKLRACEIINELENNKRGVYGGAVGYLAYNGDMDTCISIRLAYKRGGRVYVRSGGGVVADSVPNNEYEESCNKARAVVRVLKGEVKQ